MENKQSIYEDLLIQYNGLSDLEKNAILVYKSKLFVIINSISKIPEFQRLTTLELNEQLSNRSECINVFNDYSRVLNNLNNSFIKNTVFNNIRFDSFNNFIEDLKEVIVILNKISFKIVLNEDLVVYRSILVGNNEKFDFINDSPSFISTSIKVDDAERFLNGDSNKEKHFYSIKLPKGLPVIVSPFSIVRKYDSVIDSIQSNFDYSLMVSNRGVNGQQEIILFKDLISYKEFDNKLITDEFGSICIHKVEILLKDNIYFDSQ